jgi:hypothetical protein
MRVADMDLDDIINLRLAHSFGDELWDYRLLTRRRDTNRDAVPDVNADLPSWSRQDPCSK